MPDREEDIRACALAACHRVGLYAPIQDAQSEAFLSRVASELVDASDDACPVAPPYSDVLLTFRQRMSSALEDRGYTRVRIFLQRLCSVRDPGGEPFTWRDFCRWHVTRVGR